MLACVNPTYTLLCLATCYIRYYIFISIISRRSGINPINPIPPTVKNWD